MDCGIWFGDGGAPMKYDPFPLPRDNGAEASMVGAISDLVDSNSSINGRDIDGVAAGGAAGMEGVGREICTPG